MTAAISRFTILPAAASLIFNRFAAIFEKRTRPESGFFKIRQGFESARRY